MLQSINNIISNYKKNLISIEEVIHTLDTNNFTQEEIKESGIIYTPMYISDYIVKKLSPELNETVFEPSFGHGIFIFSLLEYIQDRFTLSSDKLKDYFLSNVYGQDIQINNLSEFKELVIAYFDKKGTVLKEGDICNFTISDTLINTSNHYDIIIGNPPYVRIKNLDKEYIEFLRKNYNSCKNGNIDLYYAFIEYAHLYSNRSGMITPNSWLYNSSAKNLRTDVKDNVAAIIDFKQIQIFKNVSVYTSIFFINNTNDIKKIMTYKENLKKKNWKLIEKNTLDNTRWSFAEQDKVKHDFKIIKYHTPIATLRDKIYITDEIKGKDTISFYKVSKIKVIEDFKNNKKQIIMPYKIIDNKYVIKKEEELSKDTLNYLLKNKEELLKRDKGKTAKYESWFAYGRKQGLNIYQENSYLIPIPGMLKDTQTFFAISINKLEAPFLFSSGFLLEVTSDDKDKILKYLNSAKFKKIIKSEGKVWKGKTIDSSYYSLSMTQLKSYLK